MNTAGRSLLVALLLLAFGLPAAAAPGNSKRPTIELKNPMVFTLAKGEADACGPGCSEWIAAQGAIADGTTARLRAFLKRNPGTRPIYFHSPGGLTSESVAVGRLLRERSMTARVARTIPEGCETDGKPCGGGRQANSPVPARLTSSFAQCNSACVYAIVGARQREVAPEAHLGVHASKTVLVGHFPKGTKVPPNLYAKFRADNQRMLRRYLADMGIATALLDAAEKIPHESIRALTRDDMMRFNIDTREVVESGWVYDDHLSESGGIFKSIDVTEGGSHFRTTMLRVSCVAPDEFVVGYAREVGAKESAFLPLKFVAAQEEFRLAPPDQPVITGNATKYFDVRRTLVPLRAFQSAAALNKLELASEGTGRAAATRLSTLGLTSALSSLSRRCRQQVSLGGTALVPRQRP